MKSAERNIGFAIKNLERALLCNTLSVKSAAGRRYDKTDSNAARMAMQQAMYQVEEAETVAKQAATLNYELSKTLSVQSLSDFSGFKSNSKFDGYGAYRVRSAIKVALKTARQSSRDMQELVKQQELSVQKCVADVKVADEELENAENALESEQVRVAFAKTYFI